MKVLKYMHECQGDSSGKHPRVNTSLLPNFESKAFFNSIYQVSTEEMHPQWNHSEVVQIS